MILKESYSKERIAGFRNYADFNKSDPAVIEKMIRAFVLLENLSLSKLNFIFKGGTCLILLLKHPNRFSIDIDILTSETRKELEQKLDFVIDNSEFTYYKLDGKRSYKGEIPKAHYKFYWTDERKDYILLDILFEEHKYSEIKKVKIKTDWLISKAPYSIVNIPTKEAILGDKLTAFAPNTTGVPYGRNKETEIVKQLFDVSVLFDEVNHLKTVYDSFIKIAENEITYRNLEITPFDVLDDIFEKALLISKRERNTEEPEKSKFKELQKGLRSFGNFLIKGNFRIENAIEASAKIAWLAVKLMNRDFSPITSYENSFELQELTNTDLKFAHINKFKRSNKPAYYYWRNCLNF